MLQAGVLVYKVSEDLMDPLAFWLLEEWSSSADLANHCSSDAYRAIAARSLHVKSNLILAAPTSLCNGMFDNDFQLGPNKV